MDDNPGLGSWTLITSTLNKLERDSMNIFDAALDSIGDGLLDSQCNNMAKGWVTDGHLAATDQANMVTGLKLLVGVFFSMLAEGQKTK